MATAIHHKGVTWIKDAVITFDPDNNSVEVAEGKTIGYNAWTAARAEVLVS
jgi:hypothetical protein